jgi:hypothetical protein
MAKANEALSPLRIAPNQDQSLSRYCARFDLIDLSPNVTDRCWELCTTDGTVEATGLQQRVQAWSIGRVGEMCFPLGVPAGVAHYEPQLLKL